MSNKNANELLRNAFLPCLSKCGLCFTFYGINVGNINSNAYVQNDVGRYDNSSEKEMPIKGHIELSRTEIAAKPPVQGTKR